MAVGNSSVCFLCLTHTHTHTHTSDKYLSIPDRVIDRGGLLSVPLYPDELARCHRPSPLQPACSHYVEECQLPPIQLLLCAGYGIASRTHVLHHVPVVASLDGAGDSGCVSC